MSENCNYNCVMKGHHVYEHVVNLGETFECLPEAVNLRDANAVTSNIVIGHFLSTCAIRVCSKHEMAKWLKLSRNNTWRKNEMTKWRNGEMTQSSVTILFSLSFRDQLQSYDPSRSQGFSSFQGLLVFKTVSDCISFCLASFQDLYIQGSRDGMHVLRCDIGQSCKINRERWYLEFTSFYHHFTSPSSLL